MPDADKSSKLQVDGMTPSLLRSGCPTTPLIPHLLDLFGRDGFQRVLVRVKRLARQPKSVRLACRRPTSRSGGGLEVPQADVFVSGAEVVPQGGTLIECSENATASALYAPDQPHKNPPSEHARVAPFWHLRVTSVIPDASGPEHSDTAGVTG